jgi:vacuolar-type H+-ATPase subunit I/STV1
MRSFTGLMYGDIGHGVLLTLAALYMVLNEKTFDAKLKNKVRVPFTRRF